jgi:cytoskeleton protein RodZ
MNDKKNELTKDDSPAVAALPAEPVTATLLASAEPAVVEAELEVELPPELPPELPGERLAARRAELRWSLEETASKLKLAPRQIAALEANDFASLPGMAIVRGFIRSYAKLLELDPAPLVEMIASEPNPAFDPMVLRRPLPSMGFPGRRYASGVRHRGNAARRMTGLAALVLIFLLMLAFAGRQMGWLTQLPFFNSPTAEAPVATDDVVIAEPVPELPASAAPPANSAANAAGVASVMPALVPNALLDPAQALEIKLREDSWIEISNQNGVKLLARMMRAGTTEKFEVKEPVVLLIGNANGVDVRLRGQSMNLKAVNNISTLKIK